MRSYADSYEQVLESYPGFLCRAHLRCLLTFWNSCRSQNFKQQHFLLSKSPRTWLSLRHLNLQVLTTVVILRFHPLDSLVCLVLDMEQKPNTKILLQALLASPWIPSCVTHALWHGWVATFKIRFYTFDFQIKPKGKILFIRVLSALKNTLLGWQ